MLCLPICGRGTRPRALFRVAVVGVHAMLEPRRWSAGEVMLWKVAK